MISPKKIHVVFIHARGVVGDSTGNLLSVTSWSDKAPFIAALHRFAARVVKLVIIEFLETQKIKFVQ